MGTDKVGHEFLLAGAGQGGAAGERAARRLWTAVGAKFAVAAGTRHRETRVWLDTFDRRLRCAGLRLARVAGTTPELLLTGPEGTVVRQPAGVTWDGRRPGRLDALPSGPVRDRLAPVVGVRALLPVVKVVATVQEVRLLNTDEKTVVRARVDRATVPGGGPLPVRITLGAVRGYQDQAERVARILTGLPGVTAAPAAEVDLVAPARPAPELPAGLAGLLLGLLDAIETNVPGTIGDIDTEFLHELRVAVRRTRSALKLAGDALPAGLADRFAGEFKWLGDLTTPVRDLDTFLLGFDALAGELTEADPGDLEPLRAYLRQQRAVQRRRLVRGLRSPRFTGLTTAWREALLAPVPAKTTAAELGAGRAALAWRRVARRGAATDATSPPEVLHDLRKRCKELRYVLELFAGVWDPQVYRALVKELKVLQDCLGDFQDAEVHRDKVRGYAAAMLAGHLAGAPTLLAMGELVARLGGRQRQAGGESVARVGRFVTEQNRRRIDGLVRAR
ncbi:MAG: hypothetical protein V7603_1 [Micromonosporaceae bacterium]